jgi:hypothetical protein
MAADAGGRQPASGGRGASACAAMTRTSWQAIKQSNNVEGHRNSITGAGLG